MNEHYPQDPHHEDQNSIGEVEVPQPHKPGFEPPRADGLVQEADALYEGLGMGAYFPSLYEGQAEEEAQNGCCNPDRKDVQPLGPDECGPDQCGCGCGEEPLE